MPTACPAKTWLRLIFIGAQADTTAACDNDPFCRGTGCQYPAGRCKRREEGLIDFGRAFHLERFVGTLVVQYLDEPIEASLLL